MSNDSDALGKVLREIREMRDSPEDEHYPRRSNTRELKPYGGGGGRSVGHFDGGIRETGPYGGGGRERDLYGGLGLSAGPSRRGGSGYGPYRGYQGRGGGGSGYGGGDDF